jgi:hypothetical protein
LTYVLLSPALNCTLSFLGFLALSAILARMAAISSELTPDFETAAAGAGAAAGGLAEAWICTAVSEFLPALDAAHPMVYADAQRGGVSCCSSSRTGRSMFLDPLIHHLRNCIYPTGSRVPNPAFLRPFGETPLSRRNPAFSNRGLAEKNRGLAQKNRGLAQKNRGLAKKYRGLADGKRGLAEKNRGLADGKRGLADGKRGFADGKRGLAEKNRGLADGKRGFAILPNLSLGLALLFPYIKYYITQSARD